MLLEVTSASILEHLDMFIEKDYTLRIHKGREFTHQSRGDGKAGGSIFNPDFDSLIARSSD